MEIKIAFKIDENVIAKLAKEAETNESPFVKNFCAELLQKIAFETKKTFQNCKKINMENPYGFPSL